MCADLIPEGDNSSEGGMQSTLCTTCSPRGISFQASQPPSSFSPRAPSKDDRYGSNRTLPTFPVIFAVFVALQERMSFVAGPGTERLGHSPVSSRSGTSRARFRTGRPRGVEKEKGKKKLAITNSSKTPVNLSNSTTVNWSLRN